MIEIMCTNLWVFYFLPLVFLSGFVPVLHCLYYYGSVIHLKFWSDNPSSILCTELFLLPEVFCGSIIILGFRDFVVAYYYFSLSLKNDIGILNAVCFKSANGVRQNGHLCNIKSTSL